jgi:hypothetical protein
MMQYDVLFTGSYHREVVAPCPAVVVKSKSHVLSRHFVRYTIIVTYSGQSHCCSSLVERAYYAESASMQVELRLRAATLIPCRNALCALFQLVLAS